MKIKNIIFDFDGVIIDSMSVRSFGFKAIFNEFPADAVDRLVGYHMANGGKSRYEKIRYFFEEILNKPTSQECIVNYAGNFSSIMRAKLINKNYLIPDTLQFLKASCQRYNMHIASGSDEKELKFLCERLGVDQYFLSIYGSPMTKSKIVKKLLSENQYKKTETALIGDSINDYDAARKNNIGFYGYNNPNLKKVSDVYLTSYDYFKQPL